MKKILLFAALTFTLLGACKKSDTTPPPFDPAGTTWTGTANVPGLSLTNRPFVLIFNADGTLGGSLTNGSSFAINGTWNLRPNNVTMHIYFTLATVSGPYIGQATLTTNNTKFDSGVATNATTPSANLNFTVTKG